MATFGQKLRGKLSIITLRSTAESDGKLDRNKTRSIPSSIRSLFTGHSQHTPTPSENSLEITSRHPLTPLAPVEVSRSTTGSETRVSGPAAPEEQAQIYPESHGKFDEEEIVRSQRQEAHCFEPDGTKEEKPKSRLREKASLAWTALKVKVKRRRAGA